MRWRCGRAGERGAGGHRSGPGVALELGVAGLSFSSAPGAGGAAVVTAAFTRAGGAAAEVSCEALLVATGRAPNVEGIGLEVQPSHPFS